MPRDIIAANADVLDVIANESSGGEKAFAEALLELLADGGYVIVGKDRMQRLAAAASKVDGGCDSCVAGLVADLREIFPEYEWKHHAPASGVADRIVTAIPKASQ